MMDIGRPLDESVGSQIVVTVQVLTRGGALNTSRATMLMSDADKRPGGAPDAAMEVAGEAIARMVREGLL